MRAMRTIVLNDPALDEGHLARLRGIGTLDLYNNTITEEQALQRIQGAEIAVVDGFKIPIHRALIEAAPGLRLLVLSSTAFHMVDFETADQRQVKIANIPDYSTEAVAEHAFALMLAVARAIPIADSAMRNHPFQIDPNEQSHRRFLGFELRGRTLGIIGLGSIGRRVAEIALCLGMQVIAYNRSPKPMMHVQLMNLNELLAASDIVSIHLAVHPETHLAVHPETEDIISDRELSLIKLGAVLINTAGSELIDNAALYRVLRGGQTRRSRVGRHSAMEPGQPPAGPE
jgi:glycerate dehydrogenase